MSNLNLIENPRNFSNLEYCNILDFFMSLRAVGLKILEVHDSAYEVEQIEGLSDEDIRALEYIDMIESIDWSHYDNVARQVAVEIFFPGTGATSLFIDALESLKFVLAQIQNKINCAQPIEFEKNFKKELSKCVANLNYCILCSFKMFYVFSGSIMISLKEYCASRNFHPESFVNMLYEYYQNHRPNLPLFDKFPELGVAIQEKIDVEYFETVVQYSNYISKKELEDIAKGILEVDEYFVTMLEDRFEQSRGGDN